MIVIQAVLEVPIHDGFTLWPVADRAPFGFLPLSAALSPAEVGTAVLCLAVCNNIDPEQDTGPSGPTDPLGAFLHGLLTVDDLFAAGGLRVTDTTASVVLLPGCCEGLEDRDSWLDVLDGDGQASFGHDPSPFAERYGDTVRLTVDEGVDSPTMELPVTELRRLLDGAERDLVGFLRLAADWAARYLPDHAAPVTAALTRALAPPVPAQA
ncbi:hypothetical protein AB0M43_27450 [Longispora sp. NPDC051575]|uniref:hypothetical protein n=1 Tax=Longispora sp. NPDC051575 TaxID=3154943 RepID=UPI003432E6D6